MILGLSVASTANEVRPWKAFEKDTTRVRPLWNEASFNAFSLASALAGYESVNWGEKVLHDGSTLHDRDSFIYGGALTLDVEFYVADRIALLANLRERCLWGGDTKKFHTQFGVGIKFVIN